MTERFQPNRKCSKKQEHAYLQKNCVAHTRTHKSKYICKKCGLCCISNMSGRKIGQTEADYVLRENDLRLNRFQTDKSTRTNCHHITAIPNIRNCLRISQVLTYLYVPEYLRDNLLAKSNVIIMLSWRVIMSHIAIVLIMTVDDIIPNQILFTENLILTLIRLNKC